MSQILSLNFSAEFSCTFDNIKYYPFGHQNCSFTFFSENSANLLPGYISYRGDRQTGEYNIDNWVLTCSDISRGNDCTNCEVIHNFLDDSKYFIFDILGHFCVQCNSHPYQGHPQHLHYHLPAPYSHEHHQSGQWRSGPNKLIIFIISWHHRLQFILMETQSMTWS